ncbi:HAMP domain-containing histidine kinase [Nonomuraea sp. MG754425]|uniref:sensor histidine kinase n=1 Tax=Nonomuraea sp. MG754425 TaxID=2570319 RepID=UPI001F422B85|nr:HAMP domain-containing sensor histidine kinase [Nonomuraea sp. MG754425]MCF6467729.1 HAMP domain-containing histidine kinase [Nonomuraea sp. MG754425]
MLSVVCTLLILIPVGLLMSAMISRTVADAMWNGTEQQAILVAANVRSGTLHHVIMPTVPGAELIQVVAPGGRILAASPDAGDRQPMDRVWPAPGDTIQDLQTCANPAPGCLRLSALRVDSAAGSPVVYAADRTTAMTSTVLDDILVAAQAALLTAVVGWITWNVTGRILRPVESITSQLDTITFNDLSRRIPEPAGRDEIARLVHALNQTLIRLERATHQQRRFVTDASHELRTPLAGLRVKLEEAQMNPQDINHDDLLGHTLGDVDRLQAITTDLLLLAGLESGSATHRESVDLTDLIRTELNRRADRIPVKARLQDGLTVDGTPTQLVRLLTNLLDNAERHARDRVEVELRGDDGQALLTVRDDGPGIPEADRERIFERFTRLDTARSRHQGGTGLGLAIAKDIAHAHSGTITVRNSAHGGAHFDVRLPLSPRPANHPTSGT